LTYIFVTALLTDGIFLLHWATALRLTQRLSVTKVRKFWFFMDHPDRWCTVDCYKRVTSR